MATKRTGARPPGSRPRRRRTADEARRAILEAARRRLAELGPDALRLQEIARDLGISHPAILHHFESREGLMRALARSTLQTLDAELVQALGDPAVPPRPAELFERVFGALGESGLARLLGWYALSQFKPEPEYEEQYILRHIAGVLYTRLQQQSGGDGTVPPREEALFTIHLAAVALLGDAVFGRLVTHSLGTAAEGSTQASFRAWLAELLAARIGLDAKPG